MNLNEINYMINDQNKQKNIIIAGQKIEKVETHIYLGQITSRTKSDERGKIVMGCISETKLCREDKNPH